MARRSQRTVPSKPAAGRYSYNKRDCVGNTQQTSIDLVQAAGQQLHEQQRVNQSTALATSMCSCANQLASTVRTTTAPGSSCCRAASLKTLADRVEQPVRTSPSQVRRQSCGSKAKQTLQKSFDPALVVSETVQVVLPRRVRIMDYAAGSLKNLRKVRNTKP